MQFRAGWLNGLLVAAILILAVVLSADFGTRTAGYFGGIPFGLSKPPAPGGRIAGHEPQAHSDAPDQQTGNQTSGTEQSPFVVKIAPSPDAYPETPEQRDEHQTKASEDWWTVVFAGIAAGATVLLVAVTGGLWVATYRLWRGTLRAIEGEEKAAKAMQRTAKAAARQARVMIRAEVAKIVLERADLIKIPRSEHITMVDIIQPGEVPKFSEPMLTFGNLGRTRGTVTIIDLHWKVVYGAQPNLPVGLPRTVEAIDRTNYTIMPDVPMQIPCDHVIIKLNDNDVGSIKIGKAWLWIYGCFTYTNIMETSYDVGFAARWESQDRVDKPQAISLARPRGFVWGGPSEYWFERRSEKDV